MRRLARLGSPGLLSLAALLAAGCTATTPAPVVNRTQHPLPPVVAMPQPADPGLAGQPGQPNLPPGMLPGQPGTTGDSGAQISPIRSGSIEPAGGAGMAGTNPNLRTGPRADKRPYSAGAVQAQPAIERPSPAVVAIASQTPPTQVSSAPSTIIQPPAGATMTPPPVAPAKPAAAGTGLLDGVTFAWPSAGAVSETFAQTSSKGLSINGRAGEPVLAAADGRVIFSGAGPRGYGNLVIVKHAGELLSVYAHNRSLSVKEGDNVKRGQKIAELGSSGTDRPKLHFEIRQQGKPIDPIAVLPRR